MSDIMSDDLFRYLIERAEKKAEEEYKGTAYGYKDSRILMVNLQTVQRWIKDSIQLKDWDCSAQAYVMLERSIERLKKRVQEVMHMLDRL